MSPDTRHLLLMVQPRDEFDFPVHLGSYIIRALMYTRTTYASGVNVIAQHPPSTSRLCPSAVRVAGPTLCCNFWTASTTKPTIACGVNSYASMLPESSRTTQFSEVRKSPLFRSICKH